MIVPPPVVQQRREASRAGWKYRLLLDDGKPPHLYILSHAPRSKWLKLTCFCTRIRKDGSCLRTQRVLDGTPWRPGVRERISVEHAPKKARA